MPKTALIWESPAPR
ncbi:hypothetical protein EYF80_065111 [Liparis tanakae]|uniref:Uncharacterized protein n=1 Tax=Liparis tanakae TaxID=230148 RepID=A0A4Z2E7X5_9TELE|nr:hypothetical protein EYF80_065111 [Liparis tanakae]